MPAAPGGPRPWGQGSKLVRDDAAAQQKFFQALGAAKTDAERLKALARKPSPREYAECFLESLISDPGGGSLLGSAARVTAPASPPSPGPGRGRSRS